MAAYKQGDLDGLCGVYAVLNGVKKVLYSEIGRNDPREEEKKDSYRELIHTMFNDFLRELESTQRLRYVIMNGMNKAILKKMIKSFNRTLEYEGWNFRLKFTDLAKEYKRINAVLDRIDEHIKTYKVANGVKGVAIVGLEGECDHWSCITGLNNQYISFYDSGSLGKVERALFGAGTPTRQRPYRIPPDEVFGLHLVRIDED